MANDDPADLNRLGAFVAVAECGGFTAAAERLGVSKARVSLDVQRLERALGAALFTRTTRRVRLTDAGQQLLDDTAPLLSGLHEAVARTHRSAAEIGGSLRIAMAVDHAAQHGAAARPASAAAPGAAHHAARQRPRERHAGRGHRPVAAHGRRLRDSSLRATRLGDFEQCVVAAPAYLQRAGLPRRPEELARHAWVALTLLPTPLTWAFTARNGHTRSVRMAARVQTDSATALRALLLAGAGVSVMDQLSVQADLAQGRLQRLLPDWRMPSGGLFAVFPPGRHLSPAARAFVEFYRTRWAA
ncbi:MAG: LysR substrate-binding domain-containing protein [Burkholderiaceae bacterium]